MFIGNKKCRIYAACGVSQTPKKISISEDRRKLIGEQYCSMEDTIYVGE